jgi:hypothetical protein
VNLSGVVTSLSSGTYTVTRRGPTTVGADGRADAAMPTTLTVIASVQPMGGRELQRLPEGLRVAERRAFYTPTALKVIGAPDVVSIDGEDWEVESVEAWGNLGAYFKAIVARIGN